MDFGGFKKFSSISLLEQISYFLQNTLTLLNENQDFEDAYLFGGMSRDALVNFSRNLTAKNESEAEELLQTLMREVGVDSLVKMRLTQERKETDEARGIKGMMDFVRRRRYSRKLHFKG